MADYEMLIIGSGPAGLTAAIYAGRAMVRTLVVGGRLAGGQLMLTSGVENFPGFSDGIQGPDLMMEMRKQAERFGAEIIDEDVDSVDLSTRPIRVFVGNRTYTADAVVIATGSSAKWMGLASETKLRGRGVSSCATCDGYFFRDKRVVVVGGGDTALEESLFLTKYASEVMIIHRRDKFRASKIMQSRATSNQKIKFSLNSVVDEILGDNKVEGVRLRNVITNEHSIVPCDGVFVAIGFQPNTKIFEGQIALDEKGYAIVKDETESSVSGVFVAGDVRDYRYRQAVTAAGEGCKAVLDALAYLEEQKAIAVSAHG
ncbi:MAG TPA: thioredoxin-disulfide reductase [Candidatus Saccharimonadales bacterium]|nr:thioredoxin-disulfide reductase [Candidatus Saccharimonadales bacterium]